MNTGISYEPGMQIIFDVVGKCTMIVFRGKIFELPGPFKNQADAIAAGERKCRELGWSDNDRKLICSPDFKQ